eukprot:scaffold36351_cov65-Phaeocystis_antarctica.AAC.7
MEAEGLWHILRARQAEQHLEAIIGSPGEPAAQALHAEFLQAYSLSSAQVPLVTFNKDILDAPFHGRESIILYKKRLLYTVETLRFRFHLDSSGSSRRIVHRFNFGLDIAFVLLHQTGVHAWLLSLTPHFIYFTLQPNTRYRVILLASSAWTHTAASGYRPAAAWFLAALSPTPSHRDSPSLTRTASHTFTVTGSRATATLGFSALLRLRTRPGIRLRPASLPLAHTRRLSL